MKIQFNNIIFGDSLNIYQKGNNKIKEQYDDNNVLISRIEYDEFDRHVDSKHFDSLGIMISHMHKEYTENGFIETFKDKYQEYLRKSYTFVEDSLKHKVEEYISKTRPEKNYINDFVYDLTGKLVKVINNGNVMNIK